MDVLERLGVSQQELAELATRHKLVRIEVFGSAARGELRPDSDVDVMITFSPDARPSLYTLVDIKDELSARFGREVDIVEAGSIRNPYRARTIAADLTLVYAA